MARRKMGREKKGRERKMCEKEKGAGNGLVIRYSERLTSTRDSNKHVSHRLKIHLSNCL